MFPRWRFVESLKFGNYLLCWCLCLTAVQSILVLRRAETHRNLYLASLLQAGVDMIPLLYRACKYVFRKSYSAFYASWSCLPCDGSVVLLKEVEGEKGPGYRNSFFESLLLFLSIMSGAAEWSLLISEVFTVGWPCVVFFLALKPRHNFPQWRNRNRVSLLLTHTPCCCCFCFYSAVKLMSVLLIRMKMKKGSSEVIVGVQLFLWGDAFIFPHCYPWCTFFFPSHLTARIRVMFTSVRHGRRVLSYSW